MSTWLKILLGVIAGVIVLMVALAVTVTLIFEPNDYRPYLVKAVEDATGRSVDLQGDLGLGLLPCCEVTLGPARLGNPEGFPAGDFARIESASLSLKLWPLLIHQQVQIGTVTLQGLDVELIQTADGRNNWQFDTGAEPAPATGGADEDDSAVAMDLAVDGVVVRDSRLGYRDETTGSHYSIADLALTTGAIELAGADAATEFPVELQATLTDEASGHEAQIDVTAQLGMAGERISVRDLAARVQALGLTARISGNGEVVGDQADLGGEFVLEETSPRDLLERFGGAPYAPADDAVLDSLSGRAHWSASTTAAAVRDLDLRLDDSHVTGRIEISDFDTLAIRYELNLDRIDVDRYLAKETNAPATGAGPGQADPEPTVIPLDALAGLDLAGQLRIGRLTSAGVALQDLVVDLTSRGDQADLRLDAGLLNGRITLQGDGPITGPEAQLSGKLTVTPVSPRELLRALDADLPTANPEVLARFGGDSRWRLSPTGFTLLQMNWQLDDTTFSGRAGIDDLTSGALHFDVALDRLNLDDYLSAETGDATDSAGSDSPEGTMADTELPLEPLRTLNMQGRLRAGELVMLGMTLRQVRAEIAASGGVVKLHPLTASLYGGAYQGNVTIDATGADADFDLQQKISGVQASEILGDLFGTTALTGSLSLDLSGTGRGSTTAALLRDMGGNVTFDLADGVYHGMDLGYELQRAQALFKREPAPAAPARKETAFKALAMRGRMVDGVLQTNVLDAETSNVKLSGRGGVNLLDLSLDYALNAEVIGKAARAAGLEDLAGLALPLSIEGPISAPKIGVDIKGLAASALKSSAERKVGDLLDRLGSKRQDDAKAPAGGADGAGSGAAQDSGSRAPAEAEEPSTRDLLKQGLRDLLKPRQSDEDGAGNRDDAS